MARVKKGMMRVKRRKNILKNTKGYKWKRKNCIVDAKEAIYHAGVHAQKGRVKKKTNFRRLWTLRINAILRAQYGLTYSKFIPLLCKKQIAVNRKILAELAMNNPVIFGKIVETVKS